jgi:hypothetical protein
MLLHCGMVSVAECEGKASTAENAEFCDDGQL